MFVIKVTISNKTGDGHVESTVCIREDNTIMNFESRPIINNNYND